MVGKGEGYLLRRRAARSHRSQTWSPRWTPLSPAQGLARRPGYADAELAGDTSSWAAGCTRGLQLRGLPPPCPRSARPIVAAAA